MFSTKCFKKEMKARKKVGKKRNYREVLILTTNVTCYAIAVAVILTAIATICRGHSTVDGSIGPVGVGAARTAAAGVAVIADGIISGQR